jgi:hypothetical protein
MRASEEIFLLALDHTELRTLLAIRHLAGSQPLVEATMEELGAVTGYGRTTLSKAVQGLSNAGFIRVERTKRNLGKLYINRYHLLPCSPERTPTGVTGDSNDITTVTTVKTNYLITNSLYDTNSHMGKKGYKEILVGNTKKWVQRGEDTSGDDNIGGMGLFDDEKPAALKHKLSTDARDPKTRYRRPQEDWTAADVAVEFSLQLSRKFPLLPGLLNTGNLRGALAKNRKQFGITSMIELEILKMFVGDARMLSEAETKPELLYKRYLRMFTTHMDKALMALNMPTRKVIAMDEVAQEELSEYIYASDGREFDNSIVGRKSLAYHESKIEGKNV